MRITRYTHKQARIDRQTRILQPQPIECLTKFVFRKAMTGCSSARRDGFNAEQPPFILDPAPALLSVLCFGVDLSKSVHGFCVVV